MAILIIPVWFFSLGLLDREPLGRCIRASSKSLKMGRQGFLIKNHQETASFISEQGIEWRNLCWLWLLQLWQWHSTHLKDSALTRLLFSLLKQLWHQNIDHQSIDKTSKIDQTFVQLAETAVAVKTLPELSTNQGKCEMCTMSNRSIICVIFQNVD